MYVYALKIKFNGSSGIFREEEEWCGTMTYYLSFTNRKKKQMMYARIF